MRPLPGTAGLPYAVTEGTFYHRLPTHGPDLIPTGMPFRLLRSTLIFVTSPGFEFLSDTQLCSNLIYTTLSPYHYGAYIQSVTR